jgi:hypothetical protein
MPTPGAETDRLRDLHDAFTWELNATIGEGREDLVAAFVADYPAQALQEITRDRLPGCGRPRESGGIAVARVAQPPPDRFLLKVSRWIRWICCRRSNVDST